MQAIYKRELRAYFKSPLGYIFLFAYFFVASAMFVAINLFLTQRTTMTAFFSYVSLVFIFTIPVLTMRLFAEERKSKTDQLLLTSPVRIIDIVLGKFLAASTVLLIGVAASTVYIPVMELYGTPAVAECLIGYLGLFLMGLFFVAFGMFMSSLTESPVIAAISTSVVILFLWLLGLMGLADLQLVRVMPLSLTWLGAALDWLLNFVSITSRLTDFTIGTLNVVPVFYFVSLTALFLFLTVRIIERRRWK